LDFTIVSLRTNPDLVGEAERVLAGNWPLFTLHGEGGARLWPRITADFAEHQVVMVGDDGRAMAVAYSVPFAWDGTDGDLPTGWDDVLQRAVADLDAGRAPTAASALSVTIDAPHRGKGLSTPMITAVKRAAAERGLAPFIVPVRPTRKSAYPLTPMERYIRWTNEDGSPFDPWVRVHWRAGASVIGVCPQSMRITGSVSDWEDWTGMRFPETGEYIVPGGLVPVSISTEQDHGLYLEPNVWMLHKN
jgi:GNAT superfamily N-acetyltransferase